MGIHKASNNSPSSVLKIITDEPATRDALDFTRYSEQLANIIMNSTPRFTIGIFGGWGTGKTTLMKMIEKKLQDADSSDILAVWFDAWKYEREKYLAIVPFIRTIRIELENHRNSKTGKRWNNVRKALGQAFDAFINSTDINLGMEKYGSTQINLSKFLDTLKAGGSVDVYGERINYHTHVTDYLKKALTDLRDPKKGGNSNCRIVAFVDDLDRVNPESSLELLESIKTFFDIEGIIYVIGMDSDSINSIVRKKYGDDFSKGLDYMQKIVQLPFQIPVWKVEDIKEIIKNGLGDSKLTEDFKNEQNQQLVIQAVKSNPRQLKRFINNIILAKAVFNELPVDGLIAVRAFDFHHEWREFLELITPNKIREEFLSTYKKFKEQKINIEEELDKLTKEPSPVYNIFQDKDILAIYKEIIRNGKPLQDFLDSGAVHALQHIGKMEDYRRALDTTKLKPTEEEFDFYERLQTYLNKTESLFLDSIEKRNELYQLIQRNHSPKEYSNINPLNPDFAPMYRNMNDEELSIFNSLRQITTEINTYDSIMLMLLDKKSVYLKKVPELKDLYDHLENWLKKYKNTFDNPEVSLIYEYEKPFPRTVRKLVERKINELKFQEHAL